MSRVALSFSFVAALSSFALAAPSFAKPPPQVPVAISASMPADAASGDAAPHESMIRIPATREAVRAMLIQNRAANLARFRAYQQLGSFPSNVYTGAALNVWRDAAGHFCTAATIIRGSGSTALVDQIAEDDNFIRLASVQSGPMMDWILTSGLTQAELALIQRPFMPVADRPQVDEPSTVAINPSLRTKETARLAKLYREIDATLVKNQKRSLEAAVDRLMKRPMLAWQLVYGQS